MSEEHGARRHAKWLGLAWIAGAGLFALAIIGGPPLLAKFIPRGLETKLRTIIQDPFESSSACRPKPAATAAWEKLKRRLGAEKFDIHLIERKEVNAVAVLGARIYYFSKLLQENESAEEVAGVLAHEMAHVELRHVMQGLITRIFNQWIFGGPALLLNLRFTSAQEAEADATALERLRAHGISPSGFARFFQRMRKNGGSKMPSILSDHPADDDRLEAINAVKTYPSTPILSAKEWSALHGFCDLDRR